MSKSVSCLILLLPFLSGCASVSYYGQAISGHLSLMAERQPIEQLLEEGGLSETLQERLLLSQRIRDFASDSLKLPDNDSYRSFVPVAGEAVVWSLVATEAYSIEPKQWCYPVIGCASYRGYFAHEDAQSHKAELEAEGLDVALEPVPAYSTLGWFDDPLPGTVIHWSEWRLAGLIFHELAHQRLYVSGDSAFNEAFANTVQQAGVTVWLGKTRPEQKLDAWRLAQQRERAFVGLLLETRARLKMLYGSDEDEQAMARGKRQVFARLEADYRDYKREWGYHGFDRWFEPGLNNARLASVATYEAWVPAFELLLERADGDFAAFYQACERLAELPPEERLNRMQQLSQAALESRRSAGIGFAAEPL